METKTFDVPNLPQDYASWTQRSAAAQSLEQVKDTILDVEEFLVELKQIRNDGIRYFVDCGGTKTQASKIAGLSRQALYKILAD